MLDIINNWSGQVAYGAARAHGPTSVAEVQDIVRKASKMRAVGARHSFNHLVGTPGDLISLRALQRRVDIDAAAMQVTIDGGITFAQLCPLLDKAGYALANLASIPDFTVVGACATATHGSGNGNRNLAAAIAALDIVTASGDLVSLKRGHPDFDGAVVGLGALGIIVSATLDLVPRFSMRQHIYLDLPFETVADNYDALAGSAYSVSLFSHWRGDTVDQAWVKRIATDAPHESSFFGGNAAVEPFSPVRGKDPTGTTEQLGAEGDWYDRLPHARIGSMPADGDELQAEYFLPRSNAGAALRALHAMQENLGPLMVVSEIRSVAADSFWLSHNYQQDSVAIHFAFQRDWSVVRQVLPLVEAALEPFAPRPHWGKMFTMSAADIQSRYPKLDAFRELAARMDPHGKFRNAYLDEYLF